MTDSFIPALANGSNLWAIEKGASGSPLPFVALVLQQHLVVAGAATAGQSRIVGVGARGARHHGEGMQAARTSSNLGLAGVASSNFAVLNHTRGAKRQHAAGAGFRIERLGEGRCCDYGRNCGDKGEFGNAGHCLSLGCEDNMDTMSCCMFATEIDGPAFNSSTLL
jgi:hypothetical protein